MRKALELLDENDAPPHIAAHLDLAISRLEKSLGRRDRSLELPEEGAHLWL